jgi:hypothetical protein
MTKKSQQKEFDDKKISKNMYVTVTRLRYFDIR